MIESIEVQNYIIDTIKDKIRYNFQEIFVNQLLERLVKEFPYADAFTHDCEEEGYYTQSDIDYIRDDNQSIGEEIGYERGCQETDEKWKEDKDNHVDELVRERLDEVYKEAVQTGFDNGRLIGRRDAITELEDEVTKAKEIVNNIKEAAENALTIRLLPKLISTDIQKKDYFVDKNSHY